MNLAPAVTIPDTVWMLATFTDATAGWIFGETAESGTTADLFGVNTPPWSCLQFFNGVPFAGFAANLQCVAAAAVNRNVTDGKAQTEITPTGKTLTGGGIEGSVRANQASGQSDRESFEARLGLTEQ